MKIKKKSWQVQNHDRYDWFVLELKERNAMLFYFGLLCLLLSLAFLAMTRISNMQVYQVNAWYKPFKFAFSNLYVLLGHGLVLFLPPQFQHTRFQLVGHPIAGF